MSGYYNQPDSEDDQFEDNTGKGLRAQFEKLLKEHNELKASLQKTNAADVLKGKGLDPALADLIPTDQDPAAWVEKYGPLLGVKQGTPSMDEDPAGEPAVQVAPDDPALAAEREALAAMHDAQETGQPATVTADILERMDKIDSEEELMKFFRQNG